MNELREEIELPPVKTTEEDNVKIRAWMKEYPHESSSFWSVQLHILARERQLKSSLEANREQKAEIERLTEDNSKLHRRNCWLETGIACAKSDRLGMKEKLDAFNSGGFADADAMAGKYLEEKAIVDRVWAALGISTYEQAGGKAIDEIVASLRASVGEKPEDAWKRGYIEGVRESALSIIPETIPQLREVSDAIYDNILNLKPLPYVAPTLPTEKEK